MHQELTIEQGHLLLTEQAKYNDGRGVNCVQGIAKLIIRGRTEEAATWWNVDADKLYQYPEMLHYMNELFQTTYGE